MSYTQNVILPYEWIPLSWARHEISEVNCYSI